MSAEVTTTTTNLQIVRHLLSLNLTAFAGRRTLTLLRDFTFSLLFRFRIMVVDLSLLISCAYATFGHLSCELPLIVVR